VGFGGGHYSPKHTEFCAETDYAIGHIFPKYAFASGIDDEVLAQAFSKTWGECHVAVVDWKGLQGGLRRVLLEKLEVMGVGEIVKI
jgi:D-aminoacyl-tRNA deacylase